MPRGAAPNNSTAQMQSSSLPFGGAVRSASRKPTAQAHRASTPRKHTAQAHRASTPRKHTAQAHRASTPRKHTAQAHCASTPRKHTAHAHRASTPRKHTAQPRNASSRTDSERLWAAATRISCLCVRDGAQRARVFPGHVGHPLTIPGRCFHRRTSGPLLPLPLLRCPTGRWTQNLAQDLARDVSQF